MSTASSQSRRAEGFVLKLHLNPFFPPTLSYFRFLGFSLTSSAPRKSFWHPPWAASERTGGAAAKFCSQGLLSLHLIPERPLQLIPVLPGAAPAVQDIGMRLWARLAPMENRNNSLRALPGNQNLYILVFLALKAACCLS